MFSRLTMDLCALTKPYLVLFCVAVARQVSPKRFYMPAALTLSNDSVLLYNVVENGYFILGHVTFHTFMKHHAADVDCTT